MSPKIWLKFLCAILDDINGLFVFQVKNVDLT